MIYDFVATAFLTGLGIGIVIGFACFAIRSGFKAFSKFT